MINSENVHYLNAIGPGRILFLKFLKETGILINEEEYLSNPQKFEKEYEIYKDEIGEIPTIIIARPMKEGDATMHTFEWGQKSVDIAENLGYNVIDIQKENTTYENVTKLIKENNPRLFVAWSHGCPNSLQGQTECMITRRFDVSEMISMIDSFDPKKLEVFRKMVNPLGDISCPGICQLDIDICRPPCLRETNINELKGAIVMANACHTGAQLAKCAELHGVQSYLGVKDLFMFPVDNLNSQDIFGEIQLEFYKSLLLGKTVDEAEQDMIKLEEFYIRKYKTVKYIALPLVWNKVNRVITGDRNATIYQF